MDPITQKSEDEAELKPSLVTRLKDMLVHYYHGFRLFFLDMKVSSRLLYKSLKGESLSRREQKQVINIFLFNLLMYLYIYLTAYASIYIYVFYLTNLNLSKCY